MAAPSKGIVPQFKFNEDQKLAYALATSNAHKYLLFYGPSRSGKSFLILYILILRALRAPGSRHAVFRGARNACERTLFKLTLKQVLNNCFAGLVAQSEIRLSDMSIEFENGSIILFDGLDADRLDKVLGDEFNTVWINECNDDEVDYGTVSQLMSRLSVVSHTIDGKILQNKMFFDCNPRFFSDWEYKAFKLNINPEDGDAMPDPEEWAVQKLRTEANQENIISDYIKTLQKGSAAKRQRFLVGEWIDENQTALFSDTMFRDTRIPRPAHVDTPDQIKEYLAGYEDDKIANIRLERITIAIDPAKSNDVKSDLNGITVQGGGKVWNKKEGRDEFHAFVLADHSMKASPNAVCVLAKDLCLEWGAQRIVYEDNATGAWLPATMFPIWEHAPLKKINANSTTGNKTDRAEPVSAQYEQGHVHNVGTLKELEAQMADWGSPASRKKSPDRMDAVVWGITELLDLAREQTRAAGYTAVKTVRLR